jgi:hypothetical protein
MLKPDVVFQNRSEFMRIFFKKLAFTAKKHFFLKRRLFHHATAAFGPCDLPAIQTFVRMGRTILVRFSLTIHKFPAVHCRPPLSLPELSNISNCTL